MNYNWNWRIFWEQTPEGTGTYFSTLMSGLEVTILTALCAWAVAFIIGSLVGIMRTLPSQLAEMLGNAYIEMFRNVPLLVQLFIWFFVHSRIAAARLGTWVKQLRNGPFDTRRDRDRPLHVVAGGGAGHRRHQFACRRASAWPAPPSA